MFLLDENMRTLRKPQQQPPWESCAIIRVCHHRYSASISTKQLNCKTPKTSMLQSWNKKEKITMSNHLYSEHNISSPSNDNHCKDDGICLYLHSEFLKCVYCTLVWRGSFEGSDLPSPCFWQTIRETVHRLYCVGWTGICG